MMEWESEKARTCRWCALSDSHVAGRATQTPTLTPRCLHRILIIIFILHDPSQQYYYYVVA